eukprot:9471577-Pyramimonas_sp.AAC.1
MWCPPWRRAHSFLKSLQQLHGCEGGVVFAAWLSLFGAARDRCSKNCSSFRDERGLCSKSGSRWSASQIR